jgi:hypothetical protein
MSGMAASAIVTHTRVCARIWIMTRLRNAAIATPDEFFGHSAIRACAASGASLHSLDSGMALRSGS